MSPELDKQLCEKYPKIFRDRHGDMRETLMCWGFDCGDGWYNILDAACANMQHHIDWHNDTRERNIKFNDMLAKARAGDHTELDEYVNVYREDARQKYKNSILNGENRNVNEPIPQVIAVQIKEKFGTLRFYYDGGDEYCRGIEAMAESMSARTCETCGTPGKLRHGGWVRTLCDQHAEEMGYDLDQKVDTETDTE